MKIGIITNYTRRNGHAPQDSDLVIILRERENYTCSRKVYEVQLIGTNGDRWNMDTDNVTAFEYEDGIDPYTKERIDGNWCEVDGVKMSEYSFEEHFGICEDCGNVWLSRLLETVDGKKVCNDCINDRNNYFWCRECRTYEATRIEHEHSAVCESEWEAHNYVYCEDCGIPIRTDDAYNYRSIILCEDCYDNRKERSVHDYSYKPSPEFYGTDSAIFFGVELEVDDGYDPEDTAESITELVLDRVYCKHDGSLSGGFEIVSHPCTLDFHKNEMNWIGIMQKALYNGFKSNDTDTCGLHVHVNRNSLGEDRKAQELTIAKLVLLVERFYDNDLLKFTRREMNRLEDWAKKPNSGINSRDNDTQIHDKLHYNVRGDRYTALNLNNSATIEFRVFRGTLKFETFIASIELCDALIKYAESHTVRGCMKAEFKNVVKQYKSQNLTDYCISRKIDMTSKGGK